MDRTQAGGEGAGSAYARGWGDGDTSSHERRSRAGCAEANGRGVQSAASPEHAGRDAAAGERELEPGSPPGAGSHGEGASVDEHGEPVGRVFDGADVLAPPLVRLEHAGSLFLQHGIVSLRPVAERGVELVLPEASVVGVWSILVLPSVGRVLLRPLVAVLLP